MHGFLIRRAIQKAMAENELQSGDYAIFWTVGAGTTCACSLYRF